MFRNLSKLLVFFLIPLAISALNLGCGGLNSSGNAPATGMAVGENPNNPPIISGGTNQASGVPGAQNTDPGVPGDPRPGVDAAAGPPPPLSGPVVAANGPVPGTQSTDSGVPSGLLYWIFLEGRVLKFNAPDDGSCQNFNDSLKVTRWVKDSNGNWAYPIGIKVDSCGKFIEECLPATATKDQPLAKYTVSYDVGNTHLETEAELASENDYQGGKKHEVIISLPKMPLEMREFTDPRGLIKSEKLEPTLPHLPVQALQPSGINP